MKRRSEITALILLLLLSSCTKITGTLTAEGDALGNWSFTPDTCVTGDRERTIGATLYSANDSTLIVKMAKDITNKVIVAVTIPETCDKDSLCKAVILNPSQCSRYSAEISLTNIRTPDDYRQADGHLNLDCMVKIGGKRSRLRGNITFSNCD